MDTSRLLEELTNADDEERAALLEELAVDMDEEIASALLEIASGDAAEEIRSAALVALGPIIEICGDDYDDEMEFEWDPEMGPGISRETFQSIVARIRELYSDERQPKLIRRRAFEVLIRDPQPWQRAEIRQHFIAGDPDWRVTAVFAMGHMTGFEREIAGTVESAEGPLLYEAVRAAGTMGVSAAASRIRAIATARDADLDLRVTAILALPHVDPDSYDLLEGLQRDRNREIAEAAEAAFEDLTLFGNESEEWEEE